MIIRAVFIDVLLIVWHFLAFCLTRIEQQTKIFENIMCLELASFELVAKCGEISSIVASHRFLNYVHRCAHFRELLEPELHVQSQSLRRSLRRGPGEP